MDQNATNATTTDMPVAPTAEEAQNELDYIQARAGKIQEEVNRLQSEYTNINLRAAFLQGVVASHKPAATKKKTKK